VDFKIRTISLDNQNIKLQIWDTAGQERFRAITKSYYHGSHGIVIVYDITDRKTFMKIPDWIEEIKQADPKNEACCLLIGNKYDMNEQRQVQTSEGEELAKEHDIPFLETSAKEAFNVDILFYSMARTMKKKNGSLKNDNKVQKVLVKGQEIRQPRSWC